MLRGYAVQIKSTIAAFHSITFQAFCSATAILVSNAFQLFRPLSNNYRVYCTHSVSSASEMTSIVSSGALNSTHSLSASETVQITPYRPIEPIIIIIITIIIIIIASKYGILSFHFGVSEIKYRTWQHFSSCM